MIPPRSAVKVWMFLGGAIIIGSVFAWWCVLRPCISMAYAHPEWWFFGRFVSGRDVHQLSHYLQYAFGLYCYVLRLLVFLWMGGALSIWVSVECSAKKFIMALTVLIGMAVYIRVPTIGAPLQKEWVTASTLIALDLLHDGGWLNHAGAIPQTFPGDANLYVTNLGITAIAPNGIGYYMSFPPLAVLFPAIVFHALGIMPSIAGIQWLAIALHVMSIVLISCMILLLWPEERSRYVGAWWAALVVAITPGSLWYFGNEYSWDTFWHHLWLMGVVLLVYFKRRVEKGKRWPLLLALSFIFFAASYAEYQGVLFAFMAGIWALYMARKDMRYFKIFIIAGVFSSLAVLLTTCQYSSLVGFSTFLSLLMKKAGDRSFIAEAPVTQIWLHYAACFGIALLVLPVLIRQKTRRILKQEAWVLFLLLGPLVVHHLLLLQWTAVHRYSVMKAVFPLAVVCACFGMYGLGEWRGSRSALRQALAAGFLIAGSVGLYDQIFARSPAREKNARLAANIRSLSSDREVLFSIGPYVLPQTLYYLRRNVQSVSDEDEARQWLQCHHMPCGHLLFFDDDRELVEHKTVVENDPGI